MALRNHLTAQTSPLPVQSTHGQSLRYLTVVVAVVIVVVAGGGCDGSGGGSV